MESLLTPYKSPISEVFAISHGGILDCSELYARLQQLPAYTDPEEDMLQPKEQQTAFPYGSMILQTTPGRGNGSDTRADVMIVTRARRCLSVLSSAFCPSQSKVGLSICASYRGAAPVYCACFARSLDRATVALLTFWTSDPYVGAPRTSSKCGHRQLFRRRWCFDGRIFGNLQRTSPYHW